MFEFSLENKSRNHFLEKYFGLGTKKSVRLRTAAQSWCFGVHHSNAPLLPALK